MWFEIFRQYPKKCCSKFILKNFTATFNDLQTERLFLLHAYEYHISATKLSYFEVKVLYRW